MFRKRRNLNSLLIFILIFLVICRFKLSADEYSITNYTKQEYKAASQNWSVTQDENGYIYVANNIGLLEFDGVIWTIYPAPDGAIIRTVAADNNNRIFTAGYRELGYWERDNLGKLVYTSLKDQIVGSFTSNEEFWNVITTDGKVYFQSFSKVFVYDYKTFEVFKPDGFINSISDGGDRIFINIMNRGIFQLKDSLISPFFLHSSFEKTEIRFVIALNDENKIIGTTNDGIFLYDGEKLSEWNAENNAYFKKNIINRACFSSDGKIVIGTILDGISVYDYSGKLLNRFSNVNGLQNNTVLGLIFDKNNNLWVSLDEGIDLVNFTADQTYSVIERSELGTVYTAAVYRDNLYMGTNQGLYLRPINSIKEPFTLVAGTQGQTWDCKIIDDRLFVNHNKGTIEIYGNKISWLSNVSGGFSIIQNPLNTESLIQSTYSNLIFYTKEKDSWKTKRVVREFNNLIRFIEGDHYGNFWASHLYRGIFRLKFNNKDSIIYSKYFGNEVFGKDFSIHVFKIENRIVFTTGKKLYTYDDLNDSIIEYNELNKNLGYYSKSTRIINATDHNYWFITDKWIGLFKINGSEISKIKEYPTELFNNQLVSGHENIVPISPTEAILCLGNGYALLDASAISPASMIADKRPELRQISIGGNNEQKTDIELTNSNVKIRYNRNNLQLRFSFPIFSNDKIRYQSFIEGLDMKWSDPIDKPIFSFFRIPVGNFVIRVRAINNWEETSIENSFNLEILPPWYRSIIAYFAYSIILIVSLLLFRQRIITRTKQRESRDREEKEKELIQLRNEKLQAELSFKSSELASSTMAIIKKNEFLLTVKEILKKQKEQLGLRYPDKYYETLVQKIDNHITSQDDWTVFEANFERAHEQFMKTLTDRYEELTPSDLRLCAFLRMNLSSKEIAPLMGISVRGVENHRYRLRKRLNLDADSNLTEFIIKL